MTVDNIYWSEEAVLMLFIFFSLLASLDSSKYIAVITVTLETISLSFFVQYYRNPQSLGSLTEFLTWTWAHLCQSCIKSHSQKHCVTSWTWERLFPLAVLIYSEAHGWLTPLPFLSDPIPHSYLISFPLLPFPSSSPALPLYLWMDIAV